MGPADGAEGGRRGEEQVLPICCPWRADASTPALPIPPLPQLHPWAFEQAVAGKLQLESHHPDGYDHRWVDEQVLDDAAGLSHSTVFSPATSSPSLIPSPRLSYFTIATFVDDHLAFHAKHLLGQ